MSGAWRHCKRPGVERVRPRCETEAPHDWPQIEFALGQFRDSLDDVVAITLTTHESAVTLARDHGLSFYDALIVATAQETGCDTLFTEDMQRGRRFGSVTIVNPFIESAP